MAGRPGRQQSLPPREVVGTLTKFHMTKEFATEFAAIWIASWNSHDLDKILSHYSDDFVIESPLALKIYPQSHGTVCGKDEVRKYWTIGLEKNPNLEFELLDLFVGVNSVALCLYNKTANRKSIEVMSFNAEDRVNKTIVNYLE